MTGVPRSAAFFLSPFDVGVWLFVPLCILVVGALVALNARYVYAMLCYATLFYAAHQFAAPSFALRSPQLRTWQQQQRQSSGATDLPSALLNRE